MSIMPSVAMKGGTFILAMMEPDTMPLAAPVRMPARMPSGRGMPMFVSTTPTTTAQKVMRVPTLRSMPPVMITMVAAIASTPLTAVAWRMARTLLVWRKFGDARLKSTNSARSPENANSLW